MAIGRAEPGPEMVAPGVRGVIAQISIIVFDVDAKGEGSASRTVGQVEQATGTALLRRLSGQE